MATLFRPPASNAISFSDAVVLVMDATGKHQAWVRWIHASINTHFQNNKGSLPMYIEGDERTLQDENEFYELRIDGPQIVDSIC